MSLPPAGLVLAIDSEAMVEPSSWLVPELNDTDKLSGKEAASAAGIHVIQVQIRVVTVSSYSISNVPAQAVGCLPGEFRFVQKMVL